MSFSSNVKAEVSNIEVDYVNLISETLGFFCHGKIENDKLKLVVLNATVAKKIYKNLKTLLKCSIDITVRKGYNFSNNYTYIINVDIEEIKKTFNIKNNFLPDSSVIDERKSLQSYLRGVFLIAGSINDPKKTGYHLEFDFYNEEIAQMINKILNSLELKSKIINRESRFVVYIKESEKIGDFLRMINASLAVMHFEDIRIYRDHKNMTNRLNNCEQANVEKTINSSVDQIKAIDKIEEYLGLDFLDDKTKETAIYRKKYPEVSLLELSDIIAFETGSKLTKSGIYHRLKKIKTIANNIKTRN